MNKNDFFSIYFVNPNGLYKLNVYALNEQEAFDFIRTLSVEDIEEYHEFLNTCSSIILEEAKDKENATNSFEQLVDVGRQGFIAGWKSYLIRFRNNEMEDSFKKYIRWWIRSFINDHLQNPPE